MALKEYVVNGSTYQYEESEAPKGAVLVAQKAAKTPTNKSRSAATKTAKTPANKGGDSAPSTATSAPAEPAPSGVEDASDPSASE